jgi:hypothetical protein
MKWIIADCKQVARRADVRSFWWLVPIYLLVLAYVAVARRKPA